MSYPQRTGTDPSPSNVVRIGAAVVTWNRHELLTECVRRLLEQTYPLVTVVVFDNGSRPPVVETLGGFLEDERLIVLRSEENLGGTAGFAGAMQGALDRGADWIWVMDDDAHPELDAAQEMLPFLRPGVAAVANYKVDSAGEPLSNHMVAEGELADGCRLRFSSFVGLCVNAETCRAVGMPDARFFTQFDDNDYCLRLRNAGPILLASRSVIRHHYERLQSVGTPPLIDVARYFQIRNSTWVKRRHQGLFAALAYALPLAAKLNCWAWRERPRWLSLRFVNHAWTSGLLGRFDNAFPFRCRRFREDLLSSRKESSRRP